jgi:hypothetical protein
MLLVMLLVMLLAMLLVINKQFTINSLSIFNITSRSWRNRKNMSSLQRSSQEGKTFAVSKIQIFYHFVQKFSKHFRSRLLLLKLVREDFFVHFLFCEKNATVRRLIKGHGKKISTFNKKNFFLINNLKKTFDKKL